MNILDKLIEKLFGETPVLFTFSQRELTYIVIIFNFLKIEKYSVLAEYKQLHTVINRMYENADCLTAASDTEHLLYRNEREIIREFLDLYCERIQERIELFNPDWEAIAMSQYELCSNIIRKLS